MASECAPCVQDVSKTVSVFCLDYGSRLWLLSTTRGERKSVIFLAMGIFFWWKNRCCVKLACMTCWYWFYWFLFDNIGIFGMGCWWHLMPVFYSHNIWQNNELIFFSQWFMPSEWDILSGRPSDNNMVLLLPVMCHWGMNKALLKIALVWLTVI